MIEALSTFVLRVIEMTGYGGIFLLMAIESANIPVPSEVIMPFAGFLAARSVFNFWLVVTVGAFGNLVGSLVSYAIAYFGSERALRWLVRRRILKEEDVNFSIRIFKNYGSATIFGARLLPIVRTFISFPAGLFKVNIWKFSFYTLAGSFLWSAFLTYLGFMAGERWRELEVYFRKFDILIAVIIVVAIWWWFKRHLSHGKIKKDENTIV